jgi:hypothetical protein
MPDQPAQLVDRNAQGFGRFRFRILGFVRLHSDHAGAKPFFYINILDRRRLRSQSGIVPI